jgi:hypothetical protein
MDESSPRRKRDKSEERRARKAEKRRRREDEDLRQLAELSVYSATDNPFHDANLSQQFRWHKKNEKERKQGLSPAEVQRRDMIRRQEAKEELERLNRKRAQREAEMRLREQEELRMSRMTDSAQMAEWMEKEGEFQLTQEARRATIRIKEKRAKAVDFLALNLRYADPYDQVDDEEDAELEIDLDEPYNIFEVSRQTSSYHLSLTTMQNLADEQVVELHDDIERYLSLEVSEVKIEFWKVRTFHTVLFLLNNIRRT